VDDSFTNARADVFANDSGKAMETCLGSPRTAAFAQAGLLPRGRTSNWGGGMSMLRFERP
jgi:hypothetical protein